MKKIVLYGAGGFGREVAYLIEKINKTEEKYDLLGFVVDEEFYKEGTIVGDYPVLGTKQWVIEHKDEVVCTCTIGEPKPRERIQEGLEAEGVTFETLVAPDVGVHKSVSIGAGTVITHRVFLTVDINIGKGVVLNGNCGVGHDAVIEDYACIMGGCSITGYVRIGRRARIGGKAYFVPHVKVGEDAVVAAGSIVFTKVKAGTTVLGNPAKRIKL